MKKGFFKVAAMCLSLILLTSNVIYTFVPVRIPVATMAETDLSPFPIDDLDDRNY